MNTLAQLLLILAFVAPFAFGLFRLKQTRQLIAGMAEDFQARRKAYAWAIYRHIYCRYRNRFLNGRRRRMKILRQLRRLGFTSFIPYLSLP